MVFGTGLINVPLGGSHARQRAAVLPARNTIFLQGPLFTQQHQLIYPKIQVDFPLDSEYDFEVVPKNPILGMSVGELVDRVIDIYEHVYNQPSSSNKNNSPKIRACGNNSRLGNNNNTNNNNNNHDYGIYAHDLDELILVEAEYSPTDGTIYLIVEPKR